MPEQELRTLLKKLHSEIEQTKSVDEKGKKLLQELGRDIQELLGRSGDAAVQPRPSTTERLEAAIDHFELTHPALTKTISDLLASLNNAGI